MCDLLCGLCSGCAWLIWAVTGRVCQREWEGVKERGLGIGGEKVRGERKRKGERRKKEGSKEGGDSLKDWLATQKCNQGKKERTNAAPSQKVRCKAGMQDPLGVWVEVRCSVVSTLFRSVR